MIVLGMFYNTTNDKNIEKKIYTSGEILLKSSGMATLNSFFFSYKAVLEFSVSTLVV